MIDTSTARLIGTALIVSEDAVATRQLAEAMQELALSVEVCVKVSDALDRVNHSKLEVVVIDFSFGNQAALVLQQVRGSASNRTAVTFAITSSSAETAHALRAGSSFALERPLTLGLDPTHPQRRLWIDCTRTPPLLPLSHLRPRSCPAEKAKQKSSVGRSTSANAAWHSAVVRLR